VIFVTEVDNSKQSRDLQKLFLVVKVITWPWAFWLNIKNYGMK